MFAVTGLESVRWEAPADETVARDLAAVFRVAFRARGIEVWSTCDSAHLCTFDGDEALVEAVQRARPEPSIVRRPAGGWGKASFDRVGTRVRADTRIVLRAGRRHADGRVVLWVSGKRAEAAAEQVRALESALAVMFDARALVQRVASLSKHAHADNRRLRRDLESHADGALDSRSESMRRCLERAHAVAPHSTTVLVTGPSGAGKERVARSIHARSPRRDGPFVKLNCGAITPTLAQSELFGHVRGAFTGASHRHRGVFERAAGGTLLLDEVGELSAAAQVMLLRVLQEGTFTAVGSEDERRVDVRVIAATHRNLTSDVAAGRFREDLFYRLAVFEVAVPGLADRLEDLPTLTRAILERLAARVDQPTPLVSPDVLDELAAHPWPGNVRELENVLEGAMVMRDGPHLTLPPRWNGHEARTASPQVVVPLELTIRAAIEHALRRSGGKVYGPGGAAQSLGLKPPTLQSKMRKLGIKRRTFVSN